MIGTMADLMAAQLVREREIQRINRSKAARCIKRIAAEKGWSEEDIEVVLGSLGVTEGEAR